MVAAAPVYLCALVLALYAYFYHETVLESIGSTGYGGMFWLDDSGGGALPGAGLKKTDKWIVVTSVQLPTEDVKRLASLPDWTLVVVGDTKTPSEWQLEGVHFLSVEAQKKLGYSIVNKLPVKSYTRKNVGYLYAIQHGAKYIYDTDDDNKPYGIGLAQFDYTPTIPGIRFQAPDGSHLNTTKRLFNPYHFAGMLNMWPRGFPLEHIQDYSKSNDSLRVCKTMKTPSVQQGLVHHDPDVDGIYRLLNAQGALGLNERFNQFTPPVVLARRTYSPWNSQNTLFNQRAFFTMFLPTTVAFRATDIWRSFYSQKLLHLIGDEIAFYPVNAIQIRNAHDYLKDFNDETNFSEVYAKAGKMIEYIDGWSCYVNDTQECAQNLADDFVEEGFWGQEDADLMKLWIKDLVKIGYEFPHLMSDPALVEYELDPDEAMVKKCRKMDFNLRMDLPVNETEPPIARGQQAIDYFGELDDWCGKDTGNNSDEFFPPADHIARNMMRIPALKQRQRQILVLTNNFPWRGSIGVLQRMYQPFFALTFFCGSYYPETINITGYPDILQPFNFVHMSSTEMRGGTSAFYCLNKIHEMRIPNIDGYVIMSDDVVFNFWHPFDPTIFQHAIGVANENRTGVWWPGGSGMTAANRTIQLVKEKYANDERVQATFKTYSEMLYKRGYASSPDISQGFQELTTLDGWIVSDWYYMPIFNMTFYYEMAELFFEAGLFHEITVSKFMHVIPHQQWRDTQRFLWGDRGTWFLKYNPDIIMLHPIKLSPFADPKKRGAFCVTVLDYFRQIVLSNKKIFKDIKPTANAFFVR